MARAMNRGEAWKTTLEIAKTALGVLLPLVGFLLVFYRSLVFQGDLEKSLKAQEEQTARALVAAFAPLDRTLSDVQKRVVELGDSVQYLRGLLKATVP